MHTMGHVEATCNPHQSSHEKHILDSSEKDTVGDVDAVISCWQTLSKGLVGSV